MSRKNQPGKPESAKREVLEDLGAVLDALPDSVVVLDPDGRVRYANESACTIHGYTREEITRLSIGDLVAPEAEPFVIEQLKTLVRDGFSRIAVPIRTKSGACLPGEEQARPVEIGGERYVVATARDVSAPRRLQEELLASESRMRSLLDGIPDVILELDRDGKVVYANRTPPGLGRPALTGLAITDVVGPESRALVQDMLDRAWRTGRGADFEVQVPDRLGRHTWWWARAVPLVREGRTDSVLVATREVTDRKLAEQAVRSAEQMLRDLLDSNRLLAVMVGADGRVTYCNDAFLTLTDFRPEEIVGARWLETCVPPDSRELVAPVLERMVRSGTMPSHFEHAIVTKDGRRRIVAWSHTMLRSPAGTVATLASLGEDVTERRADEEALRSSEERLHTLFAASVDAIALYDAETMRVIDANEAFLQLYGYRREELPGLTALDHSCEPERTREVFRHLRETGGQVKVRRRSRRKDGSEFPADISDHVYRWRGRSLVWAIIRDVTERVRAEEELRTANDRLYSTLRALPDLLFVLDRDMRVTDFHAPRIQFLYARPEDLIGRRMTETMPPDAAAVVERALDEAARTGAHYGGFYGVDLPGGRRWFELSIARRGEPEDAALSYVMLARDITQQHVAEDALRASEGMTRALVEGSGASITLFGTDGRLLLVNAIAASYLGGEPDDFVGRMLHEVVMTMDRAVLAERLAEVVRTGQPTQFEDQVRLPSGKRWFLSKWQPQRDSDGVLTGVQLVALDITDRRLAEERERSLAEKLQQTQKLESLGVLAGGIAHDFNNLLSGILGNADLALLELPKTSPARQPLEQVLSGARRAAELTRQMLAYSGKGRFTIETVRLPDVVAEMGKLLEISISKKNVLRYEFGQPVPSVDVDVAQMRQVVMNLIINASEAIGDRSGAIALRVGAAHCDAAMLAEYYLGESLSPGEYVFLEVADTGAGMTPDVKERIFEPFFSTKFAGRGLGLAAVLGIVRGHRGAVRIDSEPGRGTTFRVLLPASTRDAPARSGRESAPYRWTGSGTVLVVDDEETVLATSRRMLERMGFEVLSASGGRRALELLASRGDAIRAVLLDLTMPDMDGEQTYTAIRRILPAMPVVLSSGYSEHEVMPRFAEKGPVTFVQKPYGYESLVKVIRAALESAQPPAGRPE